MKPNALEDLIYETESRRANLSRNGDNLDVHGQLEQKEKDLILAAELGNALLAKNEELQKQIKELTEETNRKIEALEQERHVCRRKLESTQEECETKVVELQGDISEMKKQLDFREACLKQMERDKSQLIQDLQNQNQRLKTQLKESGKLEESLSSQLNSLRDQCNLKKSSLHDHESHMDILRDEVQLLSDRKLELERRLSAVSSERDVLNTTVEECQERVRMLERHVRDQDAQIRSSSRDIERLQSANAGLRDKLDALQCIGSPRSSSLLNEMECDEDYHTSSFSSLEKEVLTCYEVLRSVCSTVRLRIGGSESDSSDQSMASDLNLSQYKVGMLTSVVEELEGLLSVGGRLSVMDTDLEVEMHRCREALDRMEKELTDKNEELKSTAELVLNLKGKLEMKDTELRIAEEAVVVARADLAANGTQGEQMAEARAARDAALKRKADLELLLAKARIDVLQANSQLMEAVQQKVQLSQQLEQWQVDMQCLLDEQMKEKLTHSEKKRLAANNGTTNNNNVVTGPRRIFALFR